MYYFLSILHFYSSCLRILVFPLQKVKYNKNKQYRKRFLIQLNLPRNVMKIDKIEVEKTSLYPEYQEQNRYVFK